MPIPETESKLRPWSFLIPRLPVTGRHKLLRWPILIMARRNHYRPRLIGVVPRHQDLLLSIGMMVIAGMYITPFIVLRDPHAIDYCLRYLGHPDALNNSLVHRFNPHLNRLSLIDRADDD